MSNILFIGGTGCISLSCVERAVQQGHSVTVFNRGNSNSELPEAVTTIQGELFDEAYQSLAKQNYDTICQFIAFTPAQVERDLALFTGHTEQYIFISSASAYQKPTTSKPITEDVPLINPDWQYSRDKAACETLIEASDIPYTIVRPSHTMRTGLPYMLSGSPTLLHRLRAGKPIIVPGDGTSFWTLTRTEDFAVPFVNLLGNLRAINEVFHITGDVGFTWDHIIHTIADGIGEVATICHVTSDDLVRANPDWHGTLLGDKSHGAVFDNSKLKRIAGDFTCEDDLAKILKTPIELALVDPRKPDLELDALMDKIISSTNS